MESMPDLPPALVREIGLVIGLVAITVPLAFFLVWWTKSSRNKKIVMETSILLKKLAVLNAEYFPGENSTNREFQKNLHYAAYSRTTFDAYKDEIAQLKSEITAEQAERLHIPLETYRIIEQTLFEKRVFCLPGDAPKGQFAKKLYRLKRYIPLLVVLVALTIFCVKNVNLKSKEETPKAINVLSSEEEDALERNITAYLYRLPIAAEIVTVRSGSVWSDTSAVKEKTVIYIYAFPASAETLEEADEVSDEYVAALTTFIGKRDIDEYDIYVEVDSKYVFLNGRIKEIKR